MALAVPLSRFTSRVGGGSAFFVRRHCVCQDFSDDFFFRISGHHRRLMLSICHRSQTSVSSRRFIQRRRAAEPSSPLMTPEIIGFIPSGGTRVIGRQDMEHFGMDTTPEVTRIALSERESLRMRRLKIYTMTPNKSPEPTAVGAFSSAFAVHVASRRWLSFLR